MVGRGGAHLPPRRLLPPRLHRQHVGQRARARGVLGASRAKSARHARPAVVGEQRAHLSVFARPPSRLQRANLQRVVGHIRLHAVIRLDCGTDRRRVG